MELRQLTSKDIFPMCQIIKKIGIDEFKNCFSTANIQAVVAQNKDTDADLATQVGVSVVFDLVSIIIGNLPKCREDLYDFLASLTGATKNELEDLSLGEFTQLIINLVQKEDFKDFIGVVSKLFK